MSLFFPKHEALPAPHELRRVWPMGNHPKLPRTREAVAIHEAGHAAVALTLGLPCHAIQIDGNGAAAVGGFAMSPAADLDSIGTPDVHLPLPVDTASLLVQALARAHGLSLEQAAVDLATMASAGRQAEILAAGMAWPGVLWSEDRDGFCTRAYLAAASGSPVGLGYVQRRARALLTQQWSSVQQIAAQLVSSGQWMNPC